MFTIYDIHPIYVAPTNLIPFYTKPKIKSWLTDRVGDMAMAATSATALQSYGSQFLSGGKTNRSLLSSAIAPTKISGPQRKLVMAAAAVGKKSWIPAVKGGGNLLDPEWLDGS